MTEKIEKIYSKQEVEKATLQYFKGDELAAKVWMTKYCLKDEKNYYELNPDDMHKRIARELARIEAHYPNPLTEEQIYETLKGFNRIVPQGSPMSGIGNNYQITSIGNCFVIGNKFDSYGGILKIDQEQVQLMKRRGGVGHDLSGMRPNSSPVKNDALTSTGIVPFMERYSNSTKEVAQSGRRGALLLSISIKHPDSENFIDAKLTQGKVTNANVSVRINNEFMNNVINNKEFLQTYPIDLKIPLGKKYDDLIVNAKEGEIVYLPQVGYLKKINAQKIWNKIIHNAWKSAEPGVLFWDKILSESIPSCYGTEWIERSTNPCGELPLPPYDSCRLLCVNLFGYVVNPFTHEAYFNWELFKQDVQIAQRYMDDMIDLELEKIDTILNKIESDPEDDDTKSVEKKLWIKIRKMAQLGRRTGLGITAEGDMLAALGLRYGTDEATAFSEEVHKTLKLNAYRSSVIMAQERGAFPIYDAVREAQNPFIDRINQEDSDLYLDMIRYGRRNIALLTIAPTGCSDKDSIITSKEGFFKLSELCNINKNGFHELSKNINVFQDSGYANATKAFNNGFSKTKKIITSSGIELESTLNHQYKVITEDGDYIWKEVSNLIEGDMIVSRIGGYDKTTNAKLEQVSVKKNDEKYYEFKPREITQPTEITENFAKFLGIFYADGSVHDSGIRIHCNYNSEQINEVIRLVKDIFHINVKSYIERTCESVYISSTIILDFLKKNGLLKQKAHEVEIPLLIRISSKKSIEAFIAGYWMGDGGQTDNTKYIDTTSKKMAQQLAIIYRGLGKNIKISVDYERKTSKSKRPIYRVYEKGFGSINFKNERYIRKDYKNWLNLVRKYGNELFFDEIVEIFDSETMTLDIEVPDSNMYVLNSSISHNTVSLMTQTTSGIEPVFLPVYMRRRKINSQEKDARIDFVDDEGVAWQEYSVFHHKFEMWLEINGYDVNVVKTMTKEQVEEIVKKSPYHKATSNDVDWIKKIEMQGKIQCHVDHSISTTTNIPNDATEELIGKIYETGWHSGCFPKGSSVYTMGGIKDISEICIGDKVYGIDNKLHNVNKTFKLPKQKRILHHIKATGLEKISATSEHPFYVVELDEFENKKSWDDRKKTFKWKLAKDIKINDHLVVPKKLNNNIENIETLKISDYINIPTILEGDKLFLTRKLPWCKDKVVKSANSNPIPSTIKIDDDFLKFIGWFIAEGHYNGKSEIRLTLNKEKEYSVLIELSNIIENIFGVETQIEETVGNAIRLKFHSRIISAFLENLVGKYSKNKHLPDFFTKLDVNKLGILINSYYLGDGGVTISNRLARELFYSKILLNKKPYFKSNYGQGYYVNESTQNVQKTTAKELDNYYCYRVNKNEHECFNDFVYNISVDDVDSYVVNGIITHNCKGITIYREGSRNGVLLSVNDKKETVEALKETHAPKRPKRLKAEIHRFQNNLEKWIAVVGLKDGRPYEIFTGKLENGLSKLSPTIKECEVVKNIIEIEVNGEKIKKKRYDIEYIDAEGNKQIHSGLNQAFNPEFWNYSKLISGIMRHGMPTVYLYELVDSLNFKEDYINTWKNGVARVIKRYIKDGEIIKSKCPECGGTDFIFQEGCIRCSKCSWSKCN